ncbi:MAG TPA: type II secretion system protein GspC, partial [Polyangiaceae bacterium]|nr:type II secretion system protein GspC [Polyangiaceae bacterium]
MPIDQLLKRHFWAVILLLVGIAAFLDAQGIMHIVGASLGADETQLAVPPLSARLPAPPTTATPHATSAEPILSRNAFDSVTGPLNATPPPAASEIAMAPPTIDLSDPYNAPQCDGVQVLVIAASPDPDWSFAALETPADKGKSVLRRRGGDLGGKTVKFIGWDRVWMTSGSQLCQSQMFKPPVSATASAAAPPPPPPPPGGPGGVSDDIKNGIQKIGPNEYNIDRGV